MRTAITVLHPEGQQVRTYRELPERPTYRDLMDALRSFVGEYTDRNGVIDAEPIEGIPALVEGQPCDLIVCYLGEVRLGTRGPLPFNAQASALHRAVTLAERPSADPDTLAKVCGPAVLCTDRKIWFEGEI